MVISNILRFFARMGNIEKRSKRFIEKAKEKHLSKYSYDLVEYVNSTIKVKIICPIHGVFEQRPAHHLYGIGCNSCGCEITGNKNTLSKEEIITRFTKVHKNEYDYSKVDYINTKTNIEIICHKHGSFFQTPEAHFNGSGCKKCVYENNSYRKSNWIDMSKGRMGIFYKIRCFNKNEEFYKYGITYNLKKRYWCKKSMPYSFEVVKTIESKNLEKIWDLEKRFFRLFKNKKYTPLIHFEGITECFK